MGGTTEMPWLAFPDPGSHRAGVIAFGTPLPVDTAASYWPCQIPMARTD